MEAEFLSVEMLVILLIVGIYLILSVYRDKIRVNST